MLVLAAVRFMTDSTCLFEGGLMNVRFLELLGLIGMASETDVDAVCFGQARLRTGVWIMAVRAISGCAGVLDLCLFNQLGLIGVASDAQVFHIGLRQHHLAVFGRGVAVDAAILIGKGRMQELRHQLGLGGLMRIVTLQTVRGGEGLALVRLDENFILYVMTVEAKRRDSFSEVLVELQFPHFAHFVSHMARVAAHIESRVPTAFFRDIHTLIMAVETKVLAFFTGCGLK
jgi:hypothetical protein